MFYSTFLKDNSTASPPMFTNAQLKALLLPLLLEQFLSVSMGLADTVMVSGVGEAAVSSVSLVDSLNVLIIQILSALATGGAVVASQYLGRKDKKNAQLSAAQLFSVLIMLTVSFGLLCILLCRLILRTVFGSIEAHVMHYAEIYFYISAVSYPFIGLYNAGAALFRAKGDSKISMKASLVMNVVNIVGNAVLIYVFHLEVLGAAIATLTGRILAAIWVTAQLQRHDNPLRIASLADLKPNFSIAHQILAIGIPAGIENGMFQIGKLLVSHLISTLGTASIAASAVCNTLSSMINIPGNAISLATIPIIGHCLGANEKKQANQYARKLIALAYAAAWLTSPILILTAPYVVKIFNISAEAQVIAVTVIRTYCTVDLFLWPSSFMMPNILRSGGDSKYTMTVSMFSMWTFRIFLCYYFVNSLHMGLLGVWCGMFVDWFFRSLLFTIRFINGKWMEHQVI